MEDPLKERLLANKLVREVLTDGVDDNARPDIEDTSDASWSPVMQVAWPHYIMGVSRMWLEMIDQLSVDRPLHPRQYRGFQDLAAGGLPCPAPPSERDLWLPTIDLLGKTIKDILAR